MDQPTKEITLGDLVSFASVLSQKAKDVKMGAEKLENRISSMIYDGPCKA